MTLTAAKSLLFRLINELDRSRKSAILLTFDLLLIPVALYGAFALQYATLAPPAELLTALPIYLLVIGAAGLFASALGISRVKLKAYENRAIASTGLLAILIAVFAALLDKVAPVPVFEMTHSATYFVFGVNFFLLSVLSRYALLSFTLWIYRQGIPPTRVLIYGAGTTGVQLAAALKADEMIVPVGFVDDNPALQSLTVAGLPVRSPDNIRKIIEDSEIERVILAMPSLSQPRQAQIARRLEALGLDVHALPSFAQLVGAEELVSKLEPISPHDMLGRSSFDEAIPGVEDSYTGKSILISGAGGSIGSELCRQLLSTKPKRLVLYDMSELALYNIEMELSEIAKASGIEMFPVLGSVADDGRIRRTLQKYDVEVVLHAAAYKHVPLVETNATAGLGNNVFGTKTIAEAARDLGVERFILVSSDKAVRPTNFMGASKRLAELVTQDLATRSKDTLFSMVRFGNVLGSSGSVIPLFQEQISRGGPVTLTHEEVSRYFMTIPEAARLVLLAGSFSRGGDVFVLDMGDPVPIRDLARQMIEASGYTVRDAENPNGDIEIVTTGLRPGEKLHEELLIGSDMLTTPHPKILRAQEAFLSELEIANALKTLRTAIEEDDEMSARAVVYRWVEGFTDSLRQGL